MSLDSNSRLASDVSRETGARQTTNRLIDQITPADWRQVFPPRSQASADNNSATANHQYSDAMVQARPGSPSPQRDHGGEISGWYVSRLPSGTVMIRDPRQGGAEIQVHPDNGGVPRIVRSNGEVSITGRMFEPSSIPGLDLFERFGSYHPARVTIGRSPDAHRMGAVRVQRLDE